MPQVLNVRHLPGFKEHRPIIPPDALYIGRKNARYRLPASRWANPFSVEQEADREPAIAAYERWLRQQPRLMDTLSELRGRDLVCWCAPLPCHGDVLLALANSANRSRPASAHPAAPSDSPSRTRAPQKC